MQYVYYIECVPSGKKYIGKAGASFVKRWTDHIGELRRGIKANTPFGSEWLLYPSLIYWRFGITDEGVFSTSDLTELETKRITDIPIELRLNAPKTSVLSEEKRRRIASLLMQGVKGLDICKDVGCCSAYVSVVKNRLILNGANLPAKNKKQ